MQALRTRPGLRRGGIIYLCTEDIAPCPVQPRKVFDEPHSFNRLYINSFRHKKITDCLAVFITDCLIAAIF
mgnify:CR=1 FL=1